MFSVFMNSFWTINQIFTLDTYLNRNVHRHYVFARICFEIQCPPYDNLSDCLIRTVVVDSQPEKKITRTCINIWNYNLWIFLLKFYYLTQMKRYWRHLICATHLDMVETLTYGWNLLCRLHTNIRGLFSCCYICGIRNISKFSMFLQSVCWK